MIGNCLSAVAHRAVEVSINDQAWRRGLPSLDKWTLLP